MDLKFHRGLWFSDTNREIVVDPASGKKKADVALVTHAHSDHVSVGHKEYWMTLATYELLKSRGERISKTATTEFGKRDSLGNTQVSFENSGHILGSGQIVLENDSKTVVTGDFKVCDSLLTTGAEAISCDTLVMETTFGLPEFVFPKREEVYDEIGRWIKSNTNANRLSVLAGYSLGKAQELTKIVNEYSGEEPVVHEAVFRNNAVYEKFGLKLGDYELADHNLSDASVLIMPPSLMDKNLPIALQVASGKKVQCAMATGWNYSYGFDKRFCLSDHCDFNELLEFVKAVSPKRVLTMHGYAAEFARTITRKLGIPSRPLGHASQQTLAEFAFA